MSGGIVIYDDYRQIGLSLSLRITLDWELLMRLPADKRKALYQGIERVVRVVVDEPPAGE